MTEQEISSYKNKLLFFSPSEREPSYFTNSLIYICEHNAEGSMGLIINRPINIDIKEFFESLKLNIAPQTHQKKLLMGGPVNPGTVFILHSAERQWDSTIVVNKEINLSTSKDVLEAISEGKGPKDFLITLGYSGWNSGQLDDELSENAWIVVPAKFDLIFRTNSEDIINKLSKELGFDLQMVSPDFGNA